MSTLSGGEPADTAMAVYRHCLRMETYDRNRLLLDLQLTAEQLEDATEQLVSLRLLRISEKSGPRLRSVSPRASRRELIDQLEKQLLRQHHLAVTQVEEQIGAFLGAYHTHLDGQGRGREFTVIEDPGDVRREIQQTLDRCRSEVLTMQPGGGRSAVAMRQARSQDVATARRGVRVCVLYQDTARNNLATRGYAKSLTEAGGQVRTTGESFERLMIFDRELAFLPHSRSARSVPGATLITEPSTVAYLHRLFNRFWEAAASFTPETTSCKHDEHEVHLDVARLLSQGHADEAIARRLGMSVRTCRRHISRLLTFLESSSRFQAGFEVARRGLLDSHRPSGPAL